VTPGRNGRPQIDRSRPDAGTGARDTDGAVRDLFDFGFIYYWYPRETQLFYADPLLVTVSPTNFGFFS